MRNKISDLVNRISEEEFRDAVAKYFTLSSACTKLWGTRNGSSYKAYKILIELFPCDTSHFDRGKSRRKYTLIEKKCQCCGGSFNIPGTGKRKRMFCSQFCANTMHGKEYRGQNHPNWNGGSAHYIDICFRSHKKECIICGEQNVVDVHHFDKNRKNNNIENLVHLCPTHHRYMHRKCRILIIDSVVEYIEKFKSGLIV